MSFLFHSAIRVPIPFRKPCYEGRLTYGHHARRAAVDDRYGYIQLPEMFTAQGAQLIEVEVADDGKTVIKQVWRKPLDRVRDIVLVITSEGFVKTVWINLRSDKHRTLDRSKYENDGWNWDGTRKAA